MSRRDIHPQAVGVYLAYPTSETLKPIYRKLKTHVNSEHTKVGIASLSFASREREYKNTFQREVEFIRLAEVPVDRLAEVEAAVLLELGTRYARVGRAREWFQTKDREAIEVAVLEVVARVLQRDV